MSKKRRRRRRKVRPDAGGGRREESGEEFSEDEDMFMIDMSSDEEGESDGSRYVHASARAQQVQQKRDLIIMNWACREQGGLFFSLRTAARQ